MLTGITEATFSESGNIFSSILLFITPLRSEVKKSTEFIITFGGVVSIFAALFVSKHLVSFQFLVE